MSEEKEQAEIMLKGVIGPFQNDPQASCLTQFKIFFFLPRTYQAQSKLLMIRRPAKLELARKKLIV